MKVAIIGGGAAGFYAAIMVKSNYPEASVTLYEKTSKVLAKVAISGGGRCNVTNASTSIKELSMAYPRGKKLMKKLLTQFSTTDIREWFESRGVPLKAESDGRVFPVSDNSQSIVDCLHREVKKLGVTLQLKNPVKEVNQYEGQLKLVLKNGSQQVDKVIVATGGSPKRAGFQWLEDLGHAIEEPVPSLFTFNIPKEPIRELMGVSVSNTIVRIQGTKLISTGPVLVTHWGLSGPAVLKLSAFGARILHDLNYNFTALINWTGVKNYDEVIRELNAVGRLHPKKQLLNARPYLLPERLWCFLLEKMEINPTRKWIDVGSRGVYKMASVLTNDAYSVSGKTTFKEEFVTCGGVSLDSIDAATLESKSIPNLFFAGEVLNIDGITGGYNFQAAWSTAHRASLLGKTN